MNATQNYPLLVGQQTNLYKCVVENGFSILALKGYMGLIHLEGIYDDPNGTLFRKEVYRRLKYHFQFRNQLLLFAEVGDRREYSINVYKGIKEEISFNSINNLFHTSTIDGCFIHDGRGFSDGIKIKDSTSGTFVWNTKPHKDRIVHFNKERLTLLAQTFENNNDGEGARLVSIHSESIIKALEKFNSFKSSVNDYESKISEGWHETNDLNEKIIKRDTSFPDYDKYEMIYSGPHIFVSNPLYKTPKEICTEKAHYDVIDFTSIDENFTARSNYKPGEDYLNQFPDLIKGFEVGKDDDGNTTYDRWLEYYKVGFRKMLNQAGERTLTSAILPKNSSHTNGVISAIFKDDSITIELQGMVSSIVLDFFLKTVGASNLYDNRIMALPLGIEEKYKKSLFSRTLLLNCLNRYYSNLWQENFNPEFTHDCWSVDDLRLKPFESLMHEWNWNTPLRNHFERRQALVEIDVIVAMALGLSLAELVLIYNVQFPVLQQNEDDTWYDQKGNIVFTCNKGLTGVGLDRMDWERVRNNKEGDVVTHTISKSELYKGKQITYYPPFNKCNRVEDYKLAWAHFEERFGKEVGNG
jgi:hypothetical protein